MGRLPDEHPAPIGLGAVFLNFVKAPSYFPLQDAGFRVIPTDRVARKRPPAADLFGEEAKGRFDREVHPDRLNDRGNDFVS